MPKLNRKLLEKVRNHIVQVPARLDMSVYVHESDESPCGTQACVAGWAVLLGRHVPKSRWNTYRPREGEFFHAGRKVLGLTNKEANRLFNSNTDVNGAREPITRVIDMIGALLTNRKEFSRWVY